MLLASGSPRRKQILEERGHEVTVVRPVFDESQIRIEEPAALVAALAEGKGKSVACPKEMLLVASDTVVVLDGKVLGKPADEADAFAMLRAMSGRTHEVFTGVYLQYRGKAVRFTDRAEVLFRDLTDREILAYIATGSPMDKAGSYGVQDSGFVETINGSYYTVMGFPIERFTEISMELEKGI
ncbi:MAG: septum formation protein Maf [Clostridia bacterium]|nr:septum formation protein Maf [Clostridia bacterium]